MKCKACWKDNAEWIMFFDNSTVPTFVLFDESTTIVDYRTSVCDECKNKMQNDELDAMSVAS